MSGGILQLVSFGSADIYLTSNPQVTYWKQVSRRYTNFAVEPVIQSFHGIPDFGRRTSVTLSRAGDLVHKLWLELTLPPISLSTSLQNLTDEAKPGTVYEKQDYYWVNKVALALIKSVELEIGGSRIDRHTSEFLDVWSSLTTKADHAEGFKRMILDFPDKVGETNPYPEERKADKPITVYVPLMFFFTQSPGMALPLISIGFHEVRLNIEFRSLNELLIPPYGPVGIGPYTYKIQNLEGETRVIAYREYARRYLQETQVAESSATALGCDLYADTVYLDVQERRRFAKNEQEMIIPVMQFLGEEIITPEEADATGKINKRVTMNFVHPVKELIWVFVPGSKTIAKEYFAYQDVFEEVSLLFNGHERLKPRKGSYFHLIQTYQHHTHVPKEPIHVFSFALRPEEGQASGTMNFSRIDQANMLARIQLPTFTRPEYENLAGAPVEYDSGKLLLFAISYNVLRIKSGLAALAYSN